ncbi:hypothetical protein P4308_19550 [Bacillus wiedmannii]|uniref:hypothetical protein n=1 Tax=Bacillus wiedmannii TaxID=1890302 RepID=UPI002E1F0778|nr:hypothetical protein [Bacillus wiedmannii]
MSTIRDTVQNTEIIFLLPPNFFKNVLYKGYRLHHTFPNVLERSFKPGKKDVPTVVCDITEFRLVNGLKVYFCAALDISTRRVLDRTPFKYKKRAQRVYKVLEALYIPSA